MFFENDANEGGRDSQSLQEDSPACVRGAEATVNTATIRMFAEPQEPPVEIDAKDVILLIEQFLREHNLTQTLSTLQEESNVRFNIIEKPEELRNDILQGRWDAVLKVVRDLQLPSDLSADVYEQCILELVEMGERNAARALRQTPAIHALKNSDPDRYMHLESVLLVGNHEASKFGSSSHHVSTRPLYAGETRKSRRQRIAAALETWASTPGSGCATSVPPSRLLTHLGMSLRWQLENDLLPANSRLPCLLFRGGGVAIDPAAHERAPTRQYAGTTMRHHAEAGAWSPDGTTFATGAVDGGVELWGGATARLRCDIRYQRMGTVLGLPSGVTAVAIGYAAPAAAPNATATAHGGSANATATETGVTGAPSSTTAIVWAGGACGAIRGWVLRTGTVVTKAVHVGGVAGLAAAYRSLPSNAQQFAQSENTENTADGQQAVKSIASADLLSENAASANFSASAAVLASGGFDGAVRVYGYKGRLLCELRGHNAFVSFLLWMNPAGHQGSAASGLATKKLVTGCSSGSIRVWDIRSATCTRVIDLGSQSSIVGLAEGQQGTVIAATHDKQLYIVDTVGGIILSKLDVSILGPGTGDSILSMGMGPKRDLVHILSDEDIVTSIKLKSRVVERRVKVCKKAIALATHPEANAYAVWSESCELSLWCSD